MRVSVALVLNQPYQNAREEISLSRNLRITSVVLGILSLSIGVLAFSSSLPIGTAGGALCLVLGGGLVLSGIALKVVRQHLDIDTNACVIELEEFNSSTRDIQIEPPNIEDYLRHVIADTSEDLYCFIMAHTLLAAELTRQGLSHEAERALQEAEAELDRFDLFEGNSTNTLSFIKLCMMLAKVQHVSGFSEDVVKSKLERAHEAYERYLLNHDPVLDMLLDTNNGDFAYMQSLVNFMHSDAYDRMYFKNRNSASLLLGEMMDYLGEAEAAIAYFNENLPTPGVKCTDTIGIDVARRHIRAGRLLEAVNVIQNTYNQGKVEHNLKGGRKVLKACIQRGEEQTAQEVYEYYTKPRANHDPFVSYIYHDRNDHRADVAAIHFYFGNRDEARRVDKLETEYLELKELIAQVELDEAERQISQIDNPKLKARLGIEYIRRGELARGETMIREALAHSSFEWSDWKSKDWEPYLLRFTENAEYREILRLIEGFLFRESQPGSTVKSASKRGS